VDSDSPLAVLQSVFGYTDFRGHQSAIIDTLMSGDNALVLMPTGGGKSLCYQIPSLLRPGVGIIVSPLIALMQDQVDALQLLGINAAFLNSTLTANNARTIETAVIDGDLDILYIAPERLLLERTLTLLSSCQLALFAIDEAHCVSQWGHDFRPDYQALSILAERFPEVPRMALTATADQRTREEIADNLQLRAARHYVSGFDRPNIRYSITESQNAREQLWQFLEQQHPADAGIVYCLSRKKVESTAGWLETRGRVALPYHAGLRADVRSRNQQRFLREEGVIIVATIAFGMGIDKPDVRFVAHLNLPKSVEAYYQETGRAGRDGDAANAWMAYGLQDVINLRQMMQQSTADDQHKRVEHQKLEAMLGLAELSTCRRVALLDYFGEPGHAKCSNCDNCLSPPDTWDGTEASRKALSCVYRTGQRFGVNYVIDVLLGKTSDRMQRFGHTSLSTFGIGQDLSATEWRSVFRQLIAMGYLWADLESYSSLRLTDTARPLLRGEQRLELRRPVKPVKRTRRSKSATTVSLADIDDSLWLALRGCRTELAAESGVPPYVVFHDKTLRQMALELPTTRSALGAISGVGEMKLERYGDAFLAVIRDHLAVATDTD